MNEQEYIDELIDAGATDEEIAEALVMFRQRQASQAAPTPVAQEEKPATTEPSLIDYPMSVISGINRGVGKLVHEPLKLVGAAQRTLATSLGYPEGVPLPIHDLTQLGEGVEKFTEDINYRYDNVPSFIQNAGEGVGQAAGILATAGGSSVAQGLQQTGKLATGLIPAAGRSLFEIGKQVASPVGFLGGSVTAVPEWEAAKEAGLSDQEAFETLLKNYLVGQTDAIPIINFLSRWNRITNGAVMARIKNYGSSGLQEFLQEGFQTYLTNQIAKTDYDPDRDPMFQVLESASVGGVVGLLFPVLGSAMQLAPPKTKLKLQQKMATLAANEEIAKANGEELNEGVDKQVDEITNTLKTVTGEQAEPLTLTETTLPDQETGGTKPAQEFNFALPGIGTAKGMIVGDKASILEIYAETDEAGTPKKGGNLYQKVIDSLKGRGIGQIVVGMQSEGSTKALQRLVDKGVLKPNLEKNETGLHGNPIRFDIVTQQPAAPTKKATTPPPPPAAERSNPRREAIIDKVNNGQPITIEEATFLEESEARLTPKSLVDDFDQTGALLGGAEESKKATRAAASEQVADFLRGKITTRGEAVDFQDEWNQKHPERPITNTEIETAWNLIKPAPREAGPTVTLSVADALKQQIKTFYRGVEKGVRKGQKLVNTELIPKVQEALKTAKLTPRQTSAILTRLKATNLFTPGSFSKLNAFIDKVVGDAQYAEKLASARSVQKRLRRFGRQKNEKIPVNYKILARSFSQIKPAEVKDIDEYLAKADEVIAAFRPVDAGHVAPNVTEMEDYVQDILDQQEEEQERELSEKEDKTEDIRAIAEASAERLADKDLGAFDEKGKQAIETIKKIDLKQLDVDQLKRYIKIVDNIVENDDLSGEAFIENIAAVQQFVKDFSELTQGTKVSDIGIWARTMNNLSNLAKRLWQNNKIEAFFRANVHGPILTAGSQTEVTLVEASQRFDKEVKRLNKKWKTELRDINNKADMMVFSLLYQMDNDSDMAKMHRNIKETIRRNREAGNEAEANAWEKAYNSFKDVKDHNEARQIVAKKNPAVLEMWRMFGNDIDNTNGIFTEQMSEEQARVAKELYNREYATVVRYTPIVQHDVNTLYRSAKTIEDEQSETPRKTLKPSQSRTAKRRTLNLAVNKVYTLEPYTDWILRYGETVYKNKASKAEAKMAELIRHPDFTKLLGGQENAEAVVNALKRMVSIQRGTNRLIEDNEAETFFTEVAKTVRSVGTVKALASISQAVKQSTVSVKLFTNLMVEGDSDVLPAAIHAVVSMKKNDTNGVRKLLEQSTLIARGLRMGGTDRGTSEAYKLQEGARRWFFRKLENARINLDKRTRASLSLLVKPDIFNARLAFISYYLQSLKHQGVRDVDLNTEHTRLGEESRKMAMAYAENMVEKTQTASNPAAMSAIQAQTQSKGWEFVKTVFLPFSTFDADFKARFVNEFSAMRRSPSSENALRFGGTVGEALTYAALNAFVLYWYKEMLRNAIAALAGAEREKPEGATVLDIATGDFDKMSKAQRQQFVTSAVSALNPLSIGTVPQELQSKTINEIGYQIAKADNPELSKKEWMKENAIVYEPREGSLVENLGAYSTGLSPLVDLSDNIPDLVKSAMGKPVTIVDAYGNEKTINLTSEQQAILFYKSLAESLTLAGMTEADVANAIRAVYREEMKKGDTVPAKPSKNQKFKRKRKTFKRDE